MSGSLGRRVCFHDGAVCHHACADTSCYRFDARMGWIRIGDIQEIAAERYRYIMALRALLEALHKALRPIITQSKTGRDDEPRAD